MKSFLWGAIAMAAWVAGVLFWRLYRRSRDRLFVFFALGFWALGINQVVLLVVDPPSESRHYVYLIRLLAFVIIIVGIVDKNRRSR